jgi:hypothetical protein
MLVFVVLKRTPDNSELCTSRQILSFLRLAATAKKGWKYSGEVYSETVTYEVLTLDNI